MLLHMKYLVRDYFKIRNKNKYNKKKSQIKSLVLNIFIQLIINYQVQIE
jgi:hypothetical protein